MANFSMISAVALNGVIGDSLTNTMPWYLPADLKHFKEITSGFTVVMGSNTFNSIGRKLPNRKNVVITRKEAECQRLVEYGFADAAFTSFTEAAKHIREHFFVIGGQHIYQEAIKYGPSRLYLTLIDAEFAGDVVFPITGRQMKHDHFFTSSSMRYECVDRSEWAEDHGLRYQFTEFVNATKQEVRN